MRNNSNSKVCPLTLNSTNEIADRNGKVFEVKNANGKVLQIYDADKLVDYAKLFAQPLWPHNRQVMQQSDLQQLYEQTHQTVPHFVFDLLQLPYGDKNVPRTIDFHQSHPSITVGGTHLMDYISERLPLFFAPGTSSRKENINVNGKFKSWEHMVKKDKIEYLQGADIYWSSSEACVNIITKSYGRRGRIRNLVISLPYRDHGSHGFVLDTPDAPHILYVRRDGAELMSDPSVKLWKRDQTGGNLASSQTHIYNGRSYKIRTGPRGGRFILVKGSKVYV